jgi:hypothetical protein
MPSVAARIMWRRMTYRSGEEESKVSIVQPRTSTDPTLEGPGRRRCSGRGDGDRLQAHEEGVIASVWGTVAAEAVRPERRG